MSCDTYTSVHSSPSWKRKGRGTQKPLQMVLTREKKKKKKQPTAQERLHKTLEGQWKTATKHVPLCDLPWAIARHPLSRMAHPLWGQHMGFGATGPICPQGHLSLGLQASSRPARSRAPVSISTSAQDWESAIGHSQEPLRCALQPLTQINIFSQICKHACTRITA